MYGLPEITWFLDLVKELGFRRTERIDDAVDALGDALLETRIYLGGRVAGGPQDKAKENELAKLWQRASHALRRVRHDTAELARRKSEYWLDPENWEGDEAEEQSIAISNVVERYKALWKTKLL